MSIVQREIMDKGRRDQPRERQQKWSRNRDQGMEL